MYYVQGIILILSLRGLSLFFFLVFCSSEKLENGGQKFRDLT